MLYKAHMAPNVFKCSMDAPFGILAVFSSRLITELLMTFQLIGRYIHSRNYLLSTN